MARSRCAVRSEISSRDMDICVCVCACVRARHWQRIRAGAVHQSRTPSKSNPVVQHARAQCKSTPSDVLRKVTRGSRDGKTSMKITRRSRVFLIRQHLPPVALRPLAFPALHRDGSQSLSGWFCLFVWFWVCFCLFVCLFHGAISGCGANKKGWWGDFSAACDAATEGNTGLQVVICHECSAPCGCLDNGPQLFFTGGNRQIN